MTEKIETIKYDKTKWGDGPWMNEPDRMEWEHAGFPCLAIRNHMGAWCGYAAVPPGHPLHGKHYREDMEINVHGGLTYSNFCVQMICHIPKPGKPENVFWFGFDCSHLGDLTPGLHTNGAIGFKDTYKDTYKDMDYVKKETNHLAGQLKKLASK